MANAKTIDVNDLGKPKILLVGSGGSGKTSQLLTLPGKTFIYIFDPSALSTLKGHDVEYEMFTSGRVSMTVQALSKDAKKDPKIGKEEASDVYRAWETDFESKLKTGFWDGIDNICFDSFTTFGDIVMDRVLYLNGRPGHFPQQDDWTAQMQTVMSVVRTFASMNKVLVFTAHDEIKQDETTSRIQNVLLLTGKLRVKVPLLFSEIYHMECQAKPNEMKYVAQTRPDRLNPTVRCSIRDLEMYHDVTIKDWSKPQNYGIGKLLKDKLGYNPQPRLEIKPSVTPIKAEVEKKA